jgi:hypothetical protein
VAVEIASAYVSLSVSTASIPRQLRAAFANAGAEGDRAGQQAGDRMGSSFGSSLKKGAGAAIGALGIGTGVAALVGGFQQVIKVGNDFTTELNTMAAVSGATSAQLEAVSQRSRELGNDISLPGTSAGDAAAAMTELAKGGFSVEQSMAAAKGTLQHCRHSGSMPTMRRRRPMFWRMPPMRRPRRSRTSQMVFNSPVPWRISSVSRSRTPPPLSACSPTQVSRGLTPARC